MQLKSDYIEKEKQINCFILFKILSFPNLP